MKIAYEKNNVLIKLEKDDDWVINKNKPSEKYLEKIRHLFKNNEIVNSFVNNFSDNTYLLSSTVIKENNAASLKTSDIIKNKPIWDTIHL